MPPGAPMCRRPVTPATACRTGDSTLTLNDRRVDGSTGRALLERGVMDIAIGHDFDLEFSKAVELVAAALEKRLTEWRSDDDDGQADQGFEQGLAHQGFQDS